MDLSALSRAEKLELIQLLEAKRQMTEARGYDRLYPDEGPLRRELYPKHLEFFAAGARYRERCVMAANRVGKCITKQGLIDTPAGPKRVDRLRAGDVVWAWDGVRKVPAPILRPFEKPGWHECYMIVMSDGRHLEVADDHCLYLGGEWRPLSQCLEGCATVQTGKSSASAPSVRGADGLRSTGTAEGCPANCSAGSRQRDAQLLCGAASDQWRAPSPDDARQRTCRADRQGSAGTRTDSPSAPWFRRAIAGGARRLVGLFAAFLIRVGHRLSEPSMVSSLFQRPLACASSFLLRSVAVAAAPNVAAGRVRCWAFDSPLVDGNSVVAVIPVGVNRVWDFTVPFFENYCAAGLVHHNTEGMGGYESALHLTGDYPSWWQGRRFGGAVDWWAAGKNFETTRDIIQRKLLGSIGFRDGQKVLRGNGLIPRDRIGRVTWKGGVQDLVDTVEIKHNSGDWSLLGLKSYEQGRGGFEGTEKHGIWLDEEPPMAVYGECLIRTATTDGIIILTYTPLEGATEVVLAFMPPSMLNSYVEELRQRGEM